jgi:hypothetical protein
MVFFKHFRFFLHDDYWDTLKKTLYYGRISYHTYNCFNGIYGVKNRIIIYVTESYLKQFLFFFISVLKDITH